MQNEQTNDKVGGNDENSVMETDNSSLSRKRKEYINPHKDVEVSNSFSDSSPSGDKFKPVTKKNYKKRTNRKKNFDDDEYRPNRHK